MKSEVKMFMGAVGGSPKPYDECSKEYLKERFTKLIDLLKEEVQEMEDALLADHWIEVLDASIDQRYYTTQMQLYLEAAGFNVAEAERCIHLNNSLKYTTSFELANKWLDELEMETGRWDWYINTAEYEGETYYCLKKDITNKVSKYYKFPKVDLLPYVPEMYK